MNRRIAVALLLLGVVPLWMLGCASKTMKDVDPNITVLEEVKHLGVVELPRWVGAPSTYKDAKPDMEYFAGIGFPRQTLSFAMHSAAEDSYVNIAKFIGQVVAVKFKAAGEAKNVHGQQSIETVVEEFVRQTVAIARLRRAKLVESHVERVSAVHNRTQVLMYQVYQLYGVAKSDLVGLGKSSAKQAAEEIQRERDEIRKEQLKKLEELLKNLSVEDFKL